MTFDQLTEPQRYRLFALIDAINFDCLGLARYFGSNAPVIGAEVVGYWGNRPLYGLTSEYLPEFLDWPWAVDFILSGE